MWSVIVNDEEYLTNILLRLLVSAPQWEPHQLTVYCSYVLAGIVPLARTVRKFRWLYLNNGADLRIENLASNVHLVRIVSTFFDDLPFDLGVVDFFIY